MIANLTTEALPTNVPLRRFTVDEVSRMAEQGILGEDEPVELLDGELVIVSPQDPLHAARVAALARRLTDTYRDGAHLRCQLPLDARPHSLPEPDLAVVKGEPLEYEDRHPAGNDALLVVEVARTSQDMDRQKARIYAAAGVAVYWLVDLAARRLEVFSQPSDGGTFEQQRTLAPGQDVELPSLPTLDVRWPVADLVG